MRVWEGRSFFGAYAHAPFQTLGLCQLLLKSVFISFYKS